MSTWVSAGSPPSANQPSLRPLGLDDEAARARGGQRLRPRAGDRAARADHAALPVVDRDAATLGQRRHVGVRAHRSGDRQAPARIDAHGRVVDPRGGQPLAQDLGGPLRRRGTGGLDAEAQARRDSRPLGGGLVLAADQEQREAEREHDHGEGGEPADTRGDHGSLPGAGKWDGRSVDQRRNARKAPKVAESTPLSQAAPLPRLTRRQ
jgi:hypothetical protein